MTSKFFLTFGGTSVRKPADTLKQAREDARYWVAYGQRRVCIHVRVPGRNEGVLLECATRTKSRRIVVRKVKARVVR